MKSARGRIGKLDVAIALVISAVTVAYILAQAASETRDVSSLAAPFAIPIVLPVLWRRVAPIPAMAAMLVALLIHAAFFSGGGLVTCLFTVPLLFLFAYTAGARLGRDEARTALGLAAAIVVAICLTDGPEGATPDAIVLILPLTAAIWGTGRLVRSRSEMADELEVRTGELHTARDERARLEVATDRARLSSELDELLQRRLAELAQLAEVGAQETDPQTAATAFAQIEAAGRRTLDEMRAIVGVLRSDDDAPLAPQPTLTHLDALLVRAKGAGARLEVEGSPRALPPGVELSAYRVVEHLLDALDDAPGVGVRVRFADDALELTVSGPAKRRREEALKRAQERVRLHHGTLQATTHDGRSEALVSLPLYAGV